MSKTTITWLLATALLALPCAAQQTDPPARPEGPQAGKQDAKPAAKPAPDPLADLKQRMKDRYPLLETLRDAGKVGETSRGMVEVVKASEAQDKVDPKDARSATVGETVSAENTDRQQLYALLAKDLKITADEVGKQNALRILEKADADHWIKLEDGRWVQRKDVKKKEAKPGEPAQPNKR